MPELSEKQQTWAFDLANQYGFASFDEAKAVLSFVRGGAPVDDFSVFTQLRNTHQRNQQRQGLTSSQEKDQLVEGRVHRMTLEAMTRPQKDRLLAFITAVEETDLELEEDFTAAVVKLVREIKIGFINGLNKLEASNLVSRAWATSDLLGIVMNDVTGENEDTDDFATDVNTTIAGEPVSSTDSDDDDPEDSGKF